MGWAPLTSNGIMANVNLKTVGTFFVDGFSWDILKAIQSAESIPIRNVVAQTATKFAYKFKTEAGDVQIHEWRGSGFQYDKDRNPISGIASQARIYSEGYVWDTSYIEFENLNVNWSELAEWRQEGLRQPLRRGGLSVIPNIYVDAAGDNDGSFYLNSNDIVKGTDENDTFFAFKGNDKIEGFSGTDYLRGGAGNDTIYGGEGNDTIKGDRNADNLFGGKNDDRIWGGKGADTIKGGDGDDWISGDKGDDVLYGGIGQDTFFFDVGGGKDVVWDFDSSKDVLKYSENIDLATWKQDFNLVTGDVTHEFNGGAYKVNSKGEVVANPGGLTVEVVGGLFL